jgi:hypothetical protein
MLTRFRGARSPVMSLPMFAMVIGLAGDPHLLTITGIHE